MTSAYSASDGSSVLVSADMFTDEASSIEPEKSVAPSEASSSEIWIAFRLVVPSSSMSSATLAVPAAANWSAA